MNKPTLVIIAIIGLFLFTRLKRMFGYFLYAGFSPWRNKKVWAISEMIDFIGHQRFDEDEQVVIYSINAGNSGFLGTIAKTFPKAKCVAIQQKRRRLILDYIQLLFSDIKLKFEKNAYLLDIKEAKIIYLRLQPDTLLEMVKKFKYECAPGTILISNSVPVPNMVERKIFNIPPTLTQGRFTMHKKSDEELKKLASVRAEMHYLYEI
jgi:hypothetical protein